MEGETYRTYRYPDQFGSDRRAWSAARAGWDRTRPSRSRLREASEVSRILRGAELMRTVADFAALAEEEDIGLCFFRLDPPTTAYETLKRSKAEWM